MKTKNQSTILSLADHILNKVNSSLTCFPLKEKIISFLENKKGKKQGKF